MGPTPDARSTTDAQPVLFDVELPSDRFEQDAVGPFIDHPALAPLPPLVSVGSVADLTSERSRRRFTEGA